MATFYGHQLDLNGFYDVAEPADVARMVGGSIKKCGGIAGLDLGVIASVVIQTVMAAKQTYDATRPDKTTFLKFASKRIFWKIGSALRDRSAFTESSVKIPQRKRGNHSFLRLDETTDDKASPRETVGVQGASADVIMDARASLFNEISPVGEMLGILRIIPLSQSQRAFDIFEGCHGLNRPKQTLSEAARKWKLNQARPAQIMAEIWKKLAIADSPISNPLDLENALDRIADLEEVIGERSHIPQTIPSDERRRHIRGLFMTEQQRRKIRNREASYELALGSNAPIIGGSKPEMMVAAVCHAFGVGLETLRGSSSVVKVSRARHVAAFLLDRDLHLSFEQIGNLIGRSAAMARFGSCQTSREIQTGNMGAICATETARRLYAEALAALPPSV